MQKELIKEYNKVLAEIRELMIAKNTDYDSAYEIMRLGSIIDQIIVKGHRARHLEETKKYGKIESELMDIVNYCVFLLLRLNQKV